jgi:hypothetical protein
MSGRGTRWRTASMSFGVSDESAPVTFRLRLSAIVNTQIAPS